MRARRLLWSGLIGFAVLECVLQLLAVGIWLWASPGNSAAPADAPVLCIGDSYTYGLGATATARSYPGVLQKLLRQREVAVPVVNAGWPGQNSREALLRLDAQLVQHRPQLVCVLIGLNDSWTRPDRVTAEDLAAGDTKGFAWRFRTGRLLSLLWRDAPGPPNTAPPAGPVSPTPVPSTPATKAVELVRSGRHGDAISLLEAAIQSDPANAPEYHQGLVQIRVSLGQRAEAARSLQWLRDRYRAEPTRPVAEALAASLHASGEREQAALLATAAVERHPRSSTLWWIASQYHYDTDDLQAAEHELEQAIATAPPGNQAWIATLHRELARARCSRDLAGAIRAMLAAMRIDRDVERCRLIVDGAAEAFARPALERALAEIAPAGADLELLHRLFGSGWADRSAMCEVLAAHLGEIVRRCQAHGSRVVVLGYPLAVDDIEAVQREVAAAAGVTNVSCMPVFANRLRSVEREALYIRDGHCNDVGYALMAEIVLPAVLAELLR